MTELIIKGIHLFVCSFEQEHCNLSRSTKNKNVSSTILMIKHGLVTTNVSVGCLEITFKNCITTL